MSQTGVILLAAGASTRFGSDKRLAVINGKTCQQPMMLAALEQIGLSGLPVFVVLRPGDEYWENALNEREVEWGTCPEAALGMGHSLAFGVHATQHWQHWLIALADMPYIQASTYRAIATALEEHPIVRPVFKDPASGASEVGHPVGFQQRFACELMECDGDAGARGLLQRHQALVHLLPVQDAGIRIDVDQPSGLQ